MNREGKKEQESKNIPSGRKRKDAFDNLKSRRPLFWDINEKDIPQVLIESDEWIIPRVFEYGEIEDIVLVIDLYGRKRTKDVLIKEHHKLRPMAYCMGFFFLNVDPLNKYSIDS